MNFRKSKHSVSTKGNSLSSLWRLPLVEVGLGGAMVIAAYFGRQGTTVTASTKELMGLFCALVIAYGIKSPFAPIYCWAFITPIYPAFGFSIALIGGAVFTIVCSAKKRLWRWNFSGFGMVFCFWGIVSLSWGDKLDLSQTGFFATTLPGMFLAVIVAGIRDSHFRRNLAVILILSISIGCCETIHSWFSGISFTDYAEDMEYLASGRCPSFIQPDTFSSWCLFGGLSMLAFLIDKIKFPSAAWIGGALVLLLIMVGIVLSGYRSTILAIALSSAVMLLLTGRKKTAFFAISLATLAILLGSFNLGLFDLVGKRFETIQEDGGSGRLEIWHGAAQIFINHPIVGIGWDNFHFAIEEYFGQQMLPHNLYLQSFVELGFIGGVLNIIWIIHFCKKAWNAADRVWIIPILVAYLFQGFFLGQNFYLYFWLAIGCAENSSLHAHKMLRRPANKPQ